MGTDANHVGCVVFHQCEFSYVSSNGDGKQMHTRIGCTCAFFPQCEFSYVTSNFESEQMHKSHSQMLGKFEYGGGPIFKVVLEC